MSTPVRIGPSQFAMFMAVICMLVSHTAAAHPGHAHEAATDLFFAGVLHPLTGIDHLLAMFAVGMWSATTHRTLAQASWSPVSFACLLLIGAAFGVGGLRLPAVEPIIVASLLVLGLLLSTRMALPQTAGAALVGFFAFFHGLAHGAELPPGGSAGLFIAGFMLSTLALHCAGLAAGFALRQRTAWCARLLGAGTAAYGLALYAA